MRRREFISLLGGAAAARPLAALAQKPVPLIGYLSSASPKGTAETTAGFHRGLNEAGFIAGQNATMEYRWARGNYDELPAMAADLARRRVDVLVAIAPISALAAKAATSTIPIVFVSGADPVKLGLVASLNRPGGNITGVSFFISTLVAKQFQLLYELVPNAAVIAVIVNPNNPAAGSQIRDAEAAAHATGRELLVLKVSRERDIDQSFATLTERGAGALQVVSDAFFFSVRERFITLAQRHGIPTMYAYRDIVSAGGLMSYAPSLPDATRQVGIYTGRILKGEKPSELPVLQPTRFEFVINLKTSKALGLEMPAKLLALADEVIE